MFTTAFAGAIKTEESKTTDMNNVAMRFI
jgi:hypothetical protein